MNFLPGSIPINYSNVTQFYPDATGILGSFSKPPEGKTMVALDYTGLLAAQVTGGLNLTTTRFQLVPGTAPPLVISGVQLLASATLLQFLISGGVNGVVYTLTITTTLSDNLTVLIQTLEVVVSGGQVISDNGCSVLGGLPMAYNRPPYNGLFASGRVPQVFQQAEILQGDGTRFASTSIVYWVSATQPTAANINDWWWSLTTNQLYVRATDGQQVFWQVTTPPTITTWTVAPANPKVGDIWIDETDQSLNIWVNTGTAAAPIYGWFKVPTIDIDTDDDSAYGNAVITFSTTPPASPTNAQLWADPNGALSIWDNTTSAWILLGVGVTYLSANPPPNPYAGLLWANTNGSLQIYNGTTWIRISSINGGAILQYVPIAGNVTMTGPLMLYDLPATIPTDATAKAYVDTVTVDQGYYDPSGTIVNLISIWDFGASTWDGGASVWMDPTVN